MMEGAGGSARVLRIFRIGRAPRRDGDLVDGIGPAERTRLLANLARFSNAKDAGIPPDRAGVCLEEAGKYLEAGREFSSAADEQRGADRELASELYERAARNFVLAGRAFEAVDACHWAAVCNQAEEERIVRRLVDFCVGEAKKNKEGGRAERAAGQLGMAALMLEPLDFTGAFSLMMKSELVGGKSHK
ncbi:MAG: hypothetical protein AB1657_02290 [Candidatus Micrarchaeota archaeon]